MCGSRGDGSRPQLGMAVGHCSQLTVFLPVRGGLNLGWMKPHPLARASKGPGPGITRYHMMSYDTDSVPNRSPSKGNPSPTNTLDSCNSL